MRLQPRTRAARKRRKVTVRDESPGRAVFLKEVLEGLDRPRKEIPSKYFYDARGSQLFEKICDLPEYYPTRIELKIMRRHVGEMARALGPRNLLIEYGSGSGLKTRLLLDSMEELAAYVPIEISRDIQARFASELELEYPDLEVLPVIADYTSRFKIPVSARVPSRRTIYYPGSTIGNFKPRPARSFLARAARVAGKGGGLLIGVDLKKDRSVLEAAYNDRKGVTAEFNLNLLARINRELHADFKLTRFAHEAVYNEDEGRIEMHLVSKCDQCVTVDGTRFPFEKGESIFTECSYKYTVEEFGRLAGRAGWKEERVWTDPGRLFSVHYLSAT